MSIQPNPGVFDPNQDIYIRQIIGRLDNIHKQIQSIADLKPVPESVVQAAVAPINISYNLSASGEAPLNVTGLIGKLAQPQNASIPAVTSLPSISSPVSQDGAMVRLNGVLYWFDGTTEPGTWKVLGAVGTLIEDTFANLSLYPAANYPLGALFWASDRTLLYRIKLVGGVNTWVYTFGTYSVLLSSLPTPTTNDAGLLVQVSDYRHVLQWTGSSWGWGPGEIGSAYFSFFAAAPNPTNGWALCDGSVVSYLKPDGTTGSITLPDFASAKYLKASKVYASNTASGATGSEATHTHAATGLTTANESAHVHSVDPPNTTTSNESAKRINISVVAPGIDVADSPHTHDVNITAFDSAAGSAHNHTMGGSTAAGSSHSHSAGNLELANQEMICYFRL